jgi:DinB family protein
MKKFAVHGLAAVLLLGATAAAQQAAATAVAGKSPVSDTVRTIFQRQQRNLVAAAEQMPADKYGFKPTDGQIPYGQLMAHVAGSNAFLCERIGGQPAPKNLEVKPEEGKDKIVTALKASFDYCAEALKGLDDSKLGDEVTMFGGRKAPRAAALIGLTNDFADHYAAAAGYLLAAGMLPPSAQPRPAAPAAPKQ